MRSNRLFSPLILVALALLALAAGPGSRAQETSPVKARYTKHEYQITMRDGVKLFTSVYVPKDAAQKYPIRMQRTPYSVAPYGPDDYRDALGPSPRFMEEGFIFVYQDVRGRNMSEGEFAWMRPHKPKKSSPTEADETTDTWDTIEWLVKNIPNNNGRVGMWGISYPGHYSAQSLIDPHPALKAVSPQAPRDDNWLGDDMHHNGAFFLPHAFNFPLRLRTPSQRARTPGTDAVRPRDRRRLQILPRIGVARQREPEIFQRRDQTLERMDGARRLRRVLAATAGVAAFEEGHTGCDDRRRLVRRRRRSGASLDLSRDRKEQPEGVERPGRRPLVSRMLGAKRRNVARRSQLRLGHLCLLSGEDRIPILHAFPQRQGRDEFARGLRLRVRLERLEDI